MSVRDYITGKLRFPPGPPSSCGEDDVLMVEDTDLIFGDDEELKFGDDSDVGIKWDGSNLTILPLTDLTGAINIGNGTLSMDLKVFGTVAANYFEYDASEDRLNLVIVTRTITGEDHALDIAYAGVCATGGSDAMVGVNVAVTPTGTGAAWVAAFYGKVTEVAAAPGPVSGYLCAAEFEVVLTGSQPSALAVLVLNSSMSNSTHGQSEAYVGLREYGSLAMQNLLWFGDATRASASDSVILSQCVLTPLNTAIRCLVGTTPIWLYGSTIGPATLDDMTGASQILRMNAPLATWSTSYGSRHYGGSSQYSAIFSAVATASTGVSCTSVAGGNAVFLGIIEDAGIKTGANDDLCILSGRINATVAQTLGDWHGAHFYLRNSDQALTNYLYGVGIKAYVGSGGTIQRLRGYWFDFLEQSSSPPSRDWIGVGGQLTLSGSVAGNVSGFYFNNNSSGNNNVYGAWLRGRLFWGVNMGNMTREPVAGSMQINLVNLGSSDDVGIMTGAGAPATVLSGQDLGRGKGTLYIDTTNGRLYINTGTAAAATWQYFSTLT